MKTSYILLGALTSKPYSFKARSWELKNIESIDLFDSLCSNININTRGSEIMRILPINNDKINEEWISDKTRYAYDGLNRERFINPMIKKNNLYVQCSWFTAFDFIKNKIQTNSFKNLIINTGNFNDLEHMIVLDEFSKKFIKILRPSINYNIKNNADFQDYFLFNENVFNVIGNKIFILIGVNTRLENPIINVRIKKLSNQKNVLIGYIGAKNNNNLNLLHLGNNFSITKEILTGKHIFSTLISNFLKKDIRNLKIKNIFKNKISIIFGNEIVQNREHIKLIETIKGIPSLLNKFDFNVIENYVGKINFFETGLFNFNNINYTNKSILYLLNTENMKNYKKNDFVIFQGNHNLNNRKNFDVILPTSLWTEKSSLYLNCFGFIQKTQFALLPPLNCRDDWKITLMLLYNVLNLNWKNSFNSLQILNTLHEKLNIISPNLLNFIGDFNIKLILTDTIKFNKNFQKQIIYTNFPFKSFIHNYYKVTSIEKVSKTMEKCSINFLNKKINFFK